MPFLLNFVLRRDFKMHSSSYLLIRTIASWNRKFLYGMLLARAWFDITMIPVLPFWSFFQRWHVLLLLLSEFDSWTRRLVPDWLWGQTNGIQVRYGLTDFPCREAVTSVRSYKIWRWFLFLLFRRVIGLTRWWVLALVKHVIQFCFNVFLTPNKYFWQGTRMDAYADTSR